MKALRGAIWTIFVTLLTLTVTAIFQSPIADLFSGEHLQATVILSPWAEQYPTRDVPAPDPKNLSPEAQIYRDASKQLQTSINNLSVNGDREPFSLARIDIKNETKSVATNIMIDFSGFYDNNFIVLFDQKGSRKELGQISRIDLPDMKPGDKITVFAWASSSFSELLFPDSIKTYSSSGSMKIDFLWPRLESRTSENKFEWFMEDWFGWIFGVLAIFLIILLIVVMAVNEHYAKAMLHDGDFYLDEKTRYDISPKTFRPDLDRSAKITTS